jgi:hypothetical protein
VPAPSHGIALHLETGPNRIEARPELRIPTGPALLAPRRPLTDAIGVSPCFEAGFGKAFATLLYTRFKKSRFRRPIVRWRLVTLDSRFEFSAIGQAILCPSADFGDRSTAVLRRLRCDSAIDVSQTILEHFSDLPLKISREFEVSSRAG